MVAGERGIIVGEVSCRINTCSSPCAREALSGMVERHIVCWKRGPKPGVNLENLPVVCGNLVLNDSERSMAIRLPRASGAVWDQGSVGLEGRGVNTSASSAIAGR